MLCLAWTNALKPIPVCLQVEGRGVCVCGGGHHLTNGGAQSVHSAHVGVGALQKAAVAAEDVLPVVARDAAEGVVDVHDGAVRQVGVGDGDALAQIGQRVVPQLEGRLAGLALRHVLGGQGLEIQVSGFRFYGRKIGVGQRVIPQLEGRRADLVLRHALGGF